MTLTVVIGSSGSGKTTFLEDVHKSHKCTYIRQYHSLRPYIKVSSIPNFDPSALPFWKIYQDEGKADTIAVGGTMAGEFTPGLSGGQRKMLMFELVYQRTLDQDQLLLVFDEPFAGVTDDFVPWIEEKLRMMKKKHNILLVTNDHVEVLSKQADNVVTVSAMDRSHVKINDRAQVDREMAILALSVGKDYHPETSRDDMKFFFDVEIKNSAALVGVGVFTVVTYLLFLLTFWDSSPENAASVLIAGLIISFFAINPYLLSLVDWRHCVSEEAQALLHTSKGKIKLMKAVLMCILIVLISLVQYGLTAAVLPDLNDVKFWIGMLSDSFMATIPFICFGVYTSLPAQAVENISNMPFLFMIFFSTTFSPGSGVPVVKEIRYLFPRFYLWCYVPVVEDMMEGCPKTDGVNIFLLCLTGVLGLILFLFGLGVAAMKKKGQKHSTMKKRQAVQDNVEFKDLQLTLYGGQSQFKTLTTATSSLSV